MRPKQHKSFGFTLIELLVVISIIALLIAILLPALSAARESGRAAQCLSNMKQWGIAITSYAVENDYVLPQEGRSGGNNVAEAWYNIVPPFIDAPRYGDVYDGSVNPDEYDNANIWYCPTQNSLQKNSNSNKNSFHYGMNAVLNGTTSFRYANNRFNVTKNVLMDNIPKPSLVPFLLESGNVPNLGPTGIPQKDRHRQNINMAFLDGSALALPKADVERVVDADGNDASAGRQNNPLYASPDADIVWGAF